VVPYLTGEVKLAIADIGERRYAMASDDEMIRVRLFCDDLKND